MTVFPLTSLLFLPKQNKEEASIYSTRQPCALLEVLGPILGAAITPQSTTMSALSAPVFRICVLLLRVNS